MDDITKSILKKQHYYLTGNHSAVKICTWTKNSIRNEGVCYKEKFYGISSHRCCQMTPCLICDMECVFCWRNMEAHTATTMDGKIDDPITIIEECLKGQWKLINGFGGNKKHNKKKFEEAKSPNQFAISLSGEPTIYPKISELIRELHKRNCTTFLVTNGMFPSVLKKIEIPTQLYMSLDAPNENMFKSIDRPTQKNAWEKLNQSLEILNDLRKNKKARTVLRITLIKGMNDTDIEGYTELIKKANPMFIEIKAYMYVGSSRQRLVIENMPLHSEVKVFSKQIADSLGWKIIDEAEESRVCLLAEKDYKDRILNI